MIVRELRKQLIKLHIEYFEQSEKYEIYGYHNHYVRAFRALIKMDRVTSKLRQELRNKYKNSEVYQRKYGENGTRVEIIKNLILKYGKNKKGKT